MDSEDVQERFPVLQTGQRAHALTPPICIVSGAVLILMGLLIFTFAVIVVF